MSANSLWSSQFADSALEKGMYTNPSVETIAIKRDNLIKDVETS